MVYNIYFDIYHFLIIKIWYGNGVNNAITCQYIHKSNLKMHTNQSYIFTTNWLYNISKHTETLLYSLRDTLYIITIFGQTVMIVISQHEARFTNDFLPAIQIRWKFRLAVIPLMDIKSRHIFAHATTAQLSCHVQNFVAITVLEPKWEWNEISIEFELRWKKL